MSSGPTASQDHKMNDEGEGDPLTEYERMLFNQCYDDDDSEALA